MDLTQKKILTVDDNPGNLTIINGILKEFYKVYPVDSGATALRFLEKQKPDLFLIDVEMPEMSGVELFGKIKADSRFADTPVIFLTGNTETEGEEAAFKLGASDYIRKPINDTILLARIRMHLELAALREGR